MDGMPCTHCCFVRNVNCAAEITLFEQNVFPFQIQCLISKVNLRGFRMEFPRMLHGLSAETADRATLLLNGRCAKCMLLCELMQDIMGKSEK